MRKRERESAQTRKKDGAAAVVFEPARAATEPKSKREGVRRPRPRGSAERRAVCPCVRPRSPGCPPATRWPWPRPRLVCLREAKGTKTSRRERPPLRAVCRGRGDGEARRFLHSSVSPFDEESSLITSGRIPLSFQYRPYPFVLFAAAFNLPKVSFRGNSGKKRQRIGKFTTDPDPRSHRSARAATGAVIVNQSKAGAN